MTTTTTAEAATETAQPCRYCVAVWARPSLPASDRIVVQPTADDCALAHRDDPRVYALAEAFAKVMQDRHPSDEQIGWFLEDADQVVDDFDPTPDRWRVRKLPAGVNDGEREIELRLRINDVTYVLLEGGKDCRGSVVRLSEFRKWEATAT